MNALRKLQQEFLDYLLDNHAQDIVRHVTSTPQRSAEQRMMLYGHAYRMRLREALTTDFARLHTYLGDDLFDEVVEHYIDTYPSHNTSLRDFGQHMVVLIEQMSRFASVPEVAEIARIELAFGNSFDAADSPCVTLDELAQLSPDSWATLTLQFHAAVQLVAQHCNSFQIWRALSREETPPQRTEDTCNWLIWRQDLVSRYRALDEDEHAALVCMLHGNDFADLCAALLPFHDEADIPLRAVGLLQQWIHDQMVCVLACR